MKQSVYATAAIILGECINLEDVADAVHKVKLKSDLNLKTDQEIFNEALVGREMDFESEDESDVFTMQM